jgi:phosphate-selective porin OprO/OprP
MVWFRSRPEADLAPVLVDTDSMAAESVTLLALEAALVRGPAALQAEVVTAMADAPSPGGDPSFLSYYVQAAWLLTGESVSYRRAEGVFGGVAPQRNFSVADGGAGAWQLAARWSRIDLSDEGIAGGELSDISLGLNWFLNPITRITGNVVLADLESAGQMTSILTRMEIDF